MSIVRQQQELESFGDQNLVAEATKPTGQYPAYLVLSEMQRRKDLRQRASAQQHQPQPTVTEKLVAETAQGGGIAAQAPPSVPPQGGITGFAHGGPPSSGVRRQEMSGYAQGGIVRGFHEGGTPHRHPHSPNWRGITNVYRHLRDFDSISERDREQFLRNQAMLAGLNAQGPGRDPIARTQPERPMGRFTMEELTGARPAQELLEEARMDDPPHEGGYPPSEPYEVLADVMSAYGPIAGVTRAAQDDYEDYRLRGLSSIDEIRDVGEDTAERIERLAEFQRGQVQESPTEGEVGIEAAYTAAIERAQAPSALEAELQGLRRTPEETRKEKMALALSGIGAAIAGSPYRGQIGEKLGGVGREVLARGQEMRDEDIRMARDVGMLGEARAQKAEQLGLSRAEAVNQMRENRRNSNIQSMENALRSEVASSEVRMGIAREAADVQERVADRSFALRGMEMQGALTVGSAIDQANKLIVDLAEASRKEMVAKVMTPRDLTQAAGVLQRTLDSMVDQARDDYRLQADESFQSEMGRLREQIQTINQFIMMLSQSQIRRGPDIGEISPPAAPERAGFGFVPGG